MAKTLKLPILFRSVAFDRATLDEEKRTVDVSFSSEAPVDRWFGKEILDHDPKSVRMGRLENGGPALFNHDTGMHIGKITDASISGKRGSAKILFSRSALGQEKLQDVKDGILTATSVGYRVHRMKEEGKDGKETYRVLDWEPMEISLVTVPADTSVGVGRASEAQFEATIEEQATIMKRTILLDAQAISATGGADDDAQTKIVELERKATEKERKRSQEIGAYVAKLSARIPGLKELGDRALNEGMEVNEFRRRAFEILPTTERIDNASPMLGMSEKNLEKYSFARALRCATEQKLDGLEGEMHQEAIHKYRSQPKGPKSIIVPYDVLAYSKRDQLANTTAVGQQLVATQLLAGSFIEQLVNRMLVARMGATYLPGLVGNVAIPRQSGGATSYWAASEAGATTESTMTFDQVAMTPKQITARVDYSWQMLLQGTPGIETLVRTDFMKRLALGIDLASLHGSGASGQPTGIAATSSIGSVAGGTNGLAPAWSHIVGLETALANANADDNALGYLTNSRVRGKLKQTLKNSSGTDATFIWGEGRSPDNLWTVNGYRAGVSNQVSNILTKGTSTTICSAIFFGDWSQLIIGTWGGLEMLTNPYTQAGTRIIESYAYQALDIAVRHPESFAAMLDALTT